MCIKGDRVKAENNKSHFLSTLKRFGTAAGVVAGCIVAAPVALPLLGAFGAGAGVGALLIGGGSLAIGAMVGGLAGAKVEEGQRREEAAAWRREATATADLQRPSTTFDSLRSTPANASTPSVKAPENTAPLPVARMKPAAPGR